MQEGRLRRLLPGELSVAPPPPARADGLVRSGNPDSGEVAATVKV